MSKLRDKYGLGNRGLFKYLIEARRQEMVGDTALARLLIDRTQYDFPENLEARFEAVLSCMNSELKQAVLLVLDRYPRTYNEISTSLATIANVKLPAPPSFSAYCIDTLSPIGFLVHEKFGQGLGFVNHYFAVSEAAERYGQPIAAFSLRYAVDHNLSLYELFGQTQSPGDSRSPYNRARIVELVSGGHSRIVDLTEHLGLVIEDVRQHLRKLSKLRILTYDSLSFESKGMKCYTWVEGTLPGQARTVWELKKLTRDVAEWLYHNKTGERNQIAHGLNYRHVCHISEVLVGLVEQGLVNTPFAPSDKSRIMLLERSTLLSDYTRAVRNALEDKPELKNMKAMLQEFAHDREMFRRYLDAGIELYSAVSPNINARTAEERQSELMRFIETFRENKGIGPRPVDVVGGLGWTHGSVTRHLHSLYNKGSLVKERKGPVVRYRVTRPDNEITRPGDVS